ncbi:MAG: signal peptide peptidase SppA [Candidatus Neomarinimicrobiota bacterium]
MGQAELKLPPRRSGRWIWWSLGGLFALIIVYKMGSSSQGIGRGGLGEKVGIIVVEGPIYTSEKTVKDLDKFQKRNDIKAIVLRINSPGGVVGPTQEIYEKVKVLRSIKPVVSSLGAVAASGGYYIAIAGDSILANGGSILGSIGVIMEYPIARDLFEKVGLQFETVKSGDLKDTGSMTRAATARDRQYLQAVVDDLYAQFVNAVAEERSLPRTEVEVLADGRVFTGLQSLSLGLIDGIGTLEDAVALAARLGEISGEPKTVRIPKKRPSFLDWFLGDKVGQKINTVFEKIPAYRWHME